MSTHQTDLDSHKKPISKYGVRTRFTCFMRLPVECRLLIWEAALPPPRLVHIRQHRLKQTSGDLREEDGEDRPDTTAHEVNSKYGEYGRSMLEDDENHDKFDPELEDAIWWGLGAPSVVNRASEEGSGRTFRRLHKAKIYRIQSNCPPPNIYRVCRESHQFLSTMYTRTFSCLGSTAKTYFNFDLDTLYIRPHAFPCFSGVYVTKPIAELAGHLGLLDPEELARVKKLAISLEAESVVDDLHDSILALLRIFSGAEEVSLVLAEFLDGVEDRRDSQLIDAIKVRATVSAYHRHCNVLSPAFELPVPVYPIATAAQVNSRIEQAKLLLLKERGDGAARNMPLIHARSVVSATLKNELDRARRMCNLAHKNHETKMESLREAKIREKLAVVGCSTRDVFMDAEMDIEEMETQSEPSMISKDYDARQSNQGLEELTWDREDIQMVDRGEADEVVDTR